MHSVTDYENERNSLNVQSDVSLETSKIGQSSSSSIFCFLDMLDDKSNSFSLRNEQIFDDYKYTHCKDEPSDDVLNYTIGEALEKGMYWSLIVCNG